MKNYHAIFFFVGGVCQGTYWFQAKAPLTVSRGVSRIHAPGEPHVPAARTFADRQVGFSMGSGVQFLLASWFRAGFPLIPTNKLNSKYLKPIRRTYPEFNFDYRVSSMSLFDHLWKLQQLLAVSMDTTSNWTNFWRGNPVIFAALRLPMLLGPPTWVVFKGP